MWPPTSRCEARIVTQVDSVPSLDMIDLSHYRAFLTMKETVTWEFQFIGQRRAGKNQNRFS